MAPAALATGLREARVISDEVFGLVRPEALYDRPIPERHRLIFYLGHLEAFDRNLFVRDPQGPGHDRLFAFGIDPVDGRLPADAPSDWPSADEVRRYASRTREAVDRVADAGSVPDEILHVALEHRLMHAETLSYALNQMPYDRKRPPRSVAMGEAPSARSMGQRNRGLIKIPAGLATLGRRRDRGFGWDNEYEEHQVTVPAFAIDRSNVTNGEYLDFVRAGGYQDRSLWSDAAWDWLRARDAAHPQLWARRGGAWHYRAMFAEVPLPLLWPVYVSWAEAAAYARWTRRDLPTEVQWHRAACGTPSGVERRHPWGDETPRGDHGNFDMRRWDPVPVGSHPAGDSAFGVADMVGNGWEWTRTPFAPFAGFEPMACYPGYSADFFPREGPNGVHYVLKGAGPRTAARMLRRSFRNWFQPLYPYVHATFRCVTT